jgi:uncharacterized membrane protein (DUF4010 family)
MTGTPLEGALISVAIGLLLGLERQRSKRQEEELFAGIRTFPLLALSGYLAALAAGHGAPLALPAVLLCVGALGVVSYVRSPAGTGVTTEASALLAALLGAAVAWGQVPLASAVAILVTLLLTLKAPLHRIAGAVSEDEILAVLKFGVVALILLPLLPDRELGPYGALVPRRIGIIVVLLTGVSLVGYLLVRILGGRAGWALAGAVGGLVSSTAVTLSFAGKAREVPSLVRPLALGIVLASTVLYLRGAVVLAILDGAMAAYLAPRLAVLFALGAAGAALGWRRKGEEVAQPMALGNPVELGRAFVLALVFAGVIVLARAAQARLGTAGLWSVGLLGGLVDVDSVAVAAARVRQQGLVAAPQAGGAYLLATLANLLFKAGIVIVVGGRELAGRVLPVFAVLAAATAVVLLH